MMPRWLSQLFPETKAEEVKPIMAVIVEEPKKEPELVVGEPVLSLAASIATDAWELKTIEREYPSAIGWVLTHEGEGLELGFYMSMAGRSRGALIKCLVDWMTPDEQKYISGKFRDILADKAIAERKELQRIKDEENAVERQRFMVLVNK